MFTLFENKTEGSDVVSFDQFRALKPFYVRRPHKRTCEVNLDHIAEFI